jgi:acetate kinase
MWSQNNTQGGVMHILVINSGSSSIKFSIFEADAAHPDADPKALLDGELSGIGNPGASLELSGSEPRNLQAATPAEAIHAVFDELAKPGIPAVDAVGFRVVHPGPKLKGHQRITDDVLQQLEAAVAFAPLHDPEAIALIRQSLDRFPKLPHFACFDTVFHETMPPEATTYPIPLRFHDQGVHRYGFHGLSCESVVRRLHAAEIKPRRMVIAHLGSGCSVTMVVDGQSADTSMGLTPTGGVVMGTRPGDLDPGLIFYLLRQPGATVDSVEHMLNHDAGLKALAGSNDMRKLREAHDDPNARLAIGIFTDSVRRDLGGMIALHGVDAIVFTGGIGEHDARTRDAIASNLFDHQPLLEPWQNDRKGLRKISTDASEIGVYVVPAEEDLMIAVHVARMLANEPL